MARALLGSWEEAARDLRVASTLDFDEEIGLMLRKVNCLLYLNGIGFYFWGFICLS